MAFDDDPYGPYGPALEPDTAPRNDSWTLAWLYGGLGAVLGTSVGTALLPWFISPDGPGWFGGQFVAYLLAGSVIVGVPGAAVAGLLYWRPWAGVGQRRPARAGILAACLGAASCVLAVATASRVWAVIGRTQEAPPVCPLAAIALLSLVTPWILGLRIRALGRGAALANLALLVVASCLNTGVERDAILDAAGSGSVVATRFWLGIGGDPNAQDRGGATPLHYAARADNERLAALLVSCGAALNARDRSGRTPLHLAAYEGNTAMVRLLLSWDADSNIRDIYGKTALRLARERRYDTVVALLKASATPQPAIPGETFTIQIPGVDQGAPPILMEVAPAPPSGSASNYP